MKPGGLFSRSAAAVQLLWWAKGRGRRFCVAGRFLGATLHERADLVVDPFACRRAVLRPGARVLPRHPCRAERRATMRVARVEAEARVARVEAVAVRVVGDNPAATTDSRGFGEVPAHRIAGRVVCALPPEDDRG